MVSSSSFIAYCPSKKMSWNSSKLTISSPFRSAWNRFRFNFKCSFYFPKYSYLDDTLQDHRTSIIISINSWHEKFTPILDLQYLWNKDLDDSGSARESTNWLLIQDEFQFRRCDEAAAILKNPGTISQCWCEKGKPCQKLEKPVWAPGRFPSQTLSVNECKTPHFLKCKTSPPLETQINVKRIKIHFNPHLDHHLNKLLKVHRTWSIPICVLFYNYFELQN